MPCFQSIFDMFFPCSTRRITKEFPSFCEALPSLHSQNFAFSDPRACSMQGREHSRATEGVKGADGCNGDTLNGASFLDNIYLLLSQEDFFFLFLFHKL